MKEDTKKETSLSERLETLYRLRTEQAECKAFTLEKIVQVLMDQNQEHALALRALRREQDEKMNNIAQSLSDINLFISKAESVIRRALGVIDGTGNEDRTEVREALAMLLKNS